MKNLRKYYLTFFVLALTIFYSTAQSKSRTTQNIFAKEKLSLGVGVGVDYSIIGLKASYSIYKNFHAIFSISPLPKIFNYAGGAELRIPLKRNTRICPHVFMIYGRDFIVEMNDFGKKVLERKVFNSFNLGVGSKFRLFKKRKSYLSAAVTYRFIPEKTVDNFIDDFNERRNLNYSLDYNKVLFSLGYSFILLGK